MFGISASWEKMKRLTIVFEGGLTALLLLVAFGAIEAQTGPDLTKPFKKCQVYGGDRGMFRIVASDNANHDLIFQSNDNNKFASTNLESKSENWFFQNGGLIETDPLADKKNLFYVTSVKNKNEDETKSFFLNSLSLETGITNWQQQIKADSRLSLLKILHQDLVFALVDDNSVIAVRKSNGKTQWTKSYPEKIRTTGTEQDEKFIVLTQKAIYQTYAQNGNTQKHLELKDKVVTELSAIENYFILGLSTGEVIKLQKALKPSTDWKVKTGGSISGLIRIKDDILVTSQDNFLYLYSLESGKLRWKRRVSGRINIQPLINESFAVVVNENDNVALVIDLTDGRVANRIEVEGVDGFSAQPVIMGNYLILQTHKGVFFFVNGSKDC